MVNNPHSVYVISYTYPKTNKEYFSLQLCADNVYMSECDRICLFNKNDKYYIDNGRYCTGKNHIKEFDTLISALDYIFDINNPKHLNGVINIYEINYNTYNAIGILGIGLPLTPQISISQESLTLIRWNALIQLDIDPILLPIYKYCNGEFLLQHVVNFSNFNV